MDFCKPSLFQIFLKAQLFEQLLNELFSLKSILISSVHNTKKKEDAHFTFSFLSSHMFYSEVHCVKVPAVVTVHGNTAQFLYNCWVNFFTAYEIYYQPYLWTGEKHM